MVQASDELWLYHNLVGMVARKVDGEIPRAIKAFERSLELDPNRPDIFQFCQSAQYDLERSIAFTAGVFVEPSSASVWLIMVLL